MARFPVHCNASIVATYRATVLMMRYHRHCLSTFEFGKKRKQVHQEDLGMLIFLYRKCEKVHLNASRNTWKLRFSYSPTPVSNFAVWQGCILASNRRYVP
mmetsp:Transcript_11904/g.28508  ORF Transcript_11904/g.28508 Transcript_11904/m.28508 type:complete len:100 (-) Transcript_11904:37-336(-)